MVIAPTAAEHPLTTVPTDVPLSFLVVGASAESRHLVSELTRPDAVVIVASDPTEGRRSMAQRPPDVVLLDVSFPGKAALRLLEEITSRFPRTDVIVITGPTTVAAAMEAMRSGASDYVTTPMTREGLKAVLDRALDRIERDVESRHLRERLRTTTGMGPLIGTSASMEKLYRILSKVALSHHPVLIVGESGTGKELVARTVHEVGLHGAEPFVDVDCSAVSQVELDIQLFGSAKGASSRAHKDGALVTAGDGVVFLDEVGELSLELQAKLVHALLDKKVRPVGGVQPVPFSSRVLAASSRDLIAAVEQGQFRKDLYFRLNVVKLAIPPLRERREDIPMLAQHFLSAMKRQGAVSYRFSDACLRLLCYYDWPGNVTELRCAIERTCTMSSGPVLHTVDLPTQLQDFQAHLRAGDECASAPDDNSPRQIIPIAAMEKQAILSTIRQLNGDKLMAAKLLGIGKTTLYRKLKEYGEIG